VLINPHRNQNQIVYLYYPYAQRKLIKKRTTLNTIMTNPSQICASTRSSTEPSDASASAGTSAPEEAVVVNGSLRSCSSCRSTAISYECGSLVYFAALLDTIDADPLPPQDGGADDSDDSSAAGAISATILHDIQGRLVEKHLRNGTIRPKNLYVSTEAEAPRRRHADPRQGSRRPRRANIAAAAEGARSNNRSAKYTYNRAILSFTH